MVVIRNPNNNGEYPWATKLAGKLGKLKPIPAKDTDNHHPQENKMFILEVEADFAAAHQLRGYRGKCENLHGHNWRVKLAVSGTELLPTGMLMDFGALKKILHNSLAQLDHKFLNELPPFDVINPTSELLAKYLGEQLTPQLPVNVKFHALTVWESEKCRATWRA